MKKVLFLGLNSNQVPYIHKIKQMGFYIIGTDLSEKAPGIKLVNQFYKYGYNDCDALIEIGKKENFTSCDRVFTASAQFAHLGAACFANNFNINYPKFDDIKLCLDKTLFYTYFEKNDIPIPKTWYITKKEELNNILKNQLENSSFYLKSDNSKNPNYIYKFTKKDYNDIDINWKKDRYFQKYYILQEEFFGEHIRLNIFGDKYSVYFFDAKKINNDKSYQIGLVKNSKVLNKLKSLIEKLNMQNWLIKFDVIINKNFDFVVLDIGIDPPYRMLRDYQNSDLDFEKSYCQLYLNGKNIFEKYDGNI